jgi:hypothetical protein
MNPKMLIANKHSLSESSDIPNCIVSHDEQQLEVVSEAGDFTRPTLRIGDQLMAMRDASESAVRHWRGSLLV